MRRQKRPESVDLKALYFLTRVQSFREKRLSEKASAAGRSDRGPEVRQEGAANPAPFAADLKR